MTRLKKLWMTIMLLCCGMFLLAACAQEPNAQSISLNGYSPETPLEFTMGKFPYGEYTVSVVYENGESEELPLSEDMISETDKLRFYEEGENEIAITYKGVSIPITISVSRNMFPENVALNDFTATYTGETYTVKVEGDIPGGTKILYPQGNQFQSAGSYDITAVLQCDGYATKTLAARVVIEKANYDLSTAQLYDATYVYNKDAHNLILKNKTVDAQAGAEIYSNATLPKGVSVGYTITKIKDGKGQDIALNKQQVVEGNKATDAGVYKVCAQFKGDISNYNAIPDSVAYLTIERAAYDLSRVEFADTTVTYSGTANALTIPSDSKLPTDVEVSYQIKRLKDASGQSVTEEYKDGNSAKDAGVYLVKASFRIVGKNAENYQAVPAEKEAYLTVQRASYDAILQDAYIDPIWYELEEGKTYEVVFECSLPNGVSPVFALTGSDGETVVGETKKENVLDEDGNPTEKVVYKYVFSVSEEGEYTCKLRFVHENKNYEEISLKIESWVFIGGET